MNKKQIGLILSQARLKSGLTYYAIEKATGIIKAQIEAIEAGEKAYTIDSLLKLCTFFNLTLSVTE